MKEIMIGYIMVAFIMLLMIGSGLCLVVNRNNSVARMATGQHDFDNYTFIEPDGRHFVPSRGYVD